jgi:hypothetical protein
MIIRRFQAVGLSPEIVVAHRSFLTICLQNDVTDFRPRWSCAVRLRLQRECRHLVRLQAFLGSESGGANRLFGGM